MSISRQGVQRPDIIPGTLLTNSADQGVATATMTNISFDTVVYDIGGGFSSPFKILISRRGRYIVNLVVQFSEANSTGYRQIILFKNSNRICTHRHPADGTVAQIHATAIVAADIGDFFTTQAFQNSGGTLQVSATADVGPFFSANWIGEP